MVKIILVSKFGAPKEQTLFCAHLATFLAHTKKTALVDFQPQTHLLEMFIAKRHYFNLENKQDLPVPTYFTYKKTLLDEISASFDYIVLDGSNADLFPAADILITLIAEPSAVQTLTQSDSVFVQTLWQSKKTRAKAGKNAFKHILIPTDSLQNEDILKLSQSASMMGYKVAPCFVKNASYEKAFNQGLTILDKDTPCLLKTFCSADFFARRNFQHILEFIWADK